MVLARLHRSAAVERNRQGVPKMQGDRWFVAKVATTAVVYDTNPVNMPTRTRTSVTTAVRTHHRTSVYTPPPRVPQKNTISNEQALSRPTRADEAIVPHTAHDDSAHPTPPHFASVSGHNRQFEKKTINNKDGSVREKNGLKQVKEGQLSRPVVLTNRGPFTPRPRSSAGAGEGS